MQNKRKIAAVLIIVSGGFGAIGLNFFAGSIILGYSLNAISHYLNISTGVIFLFFIIPTIASIPLGIVTIILGIFALKKRNWSIALAGSITSIITFFPCGIAAIILVIKARPEFQSLAQPAPTTDMGSLTPWKSKKTALLLAIFFGPFTWLYTYRRDAWKAAVGLGFATSIAVLSIGMILLVKNTARWVDSANAPFIFNYIPFIMILVIFWIPLWLWAVIDVTTAKEWYLKGNDTRNKTTAILLAIFVSPWTWFYTYRKDAWKFWLSFILLYGNTLAFWIIMSSWVPDFEKNITMNSLPALVLPVIFNIILFGIFISAVVIAAVRPKAWYENFGGIKNPG